MASKKQELRRYFENFKRLKTQMLIQAEGMRTYMPTTFDETMVDFVFRLSRKHVIDELHDCMAKLDSATMDEKIKKLEPMCEKAN